jgi:hypothetical protein
LERVEEGLWQADLPPPQLPGSTGEETPREFKALLDRVRAAEATLDQQPRPRTAPPRAQGAAAASAGRGRRGRRPQVCAYAAPHWVLTRNGDSTFLSSSSTTFQDSCPDQLSLPTPATSTPGIVARMQEEIHGPHSRPHSLSKAHFKLLLTTRMECLLPWL